MKYINIFLFLAFAMNSAQTIPDNLTAERLKEMPDEVVDRILDGLREEDYESATIDSFLFFNSSRTFERIGKVFFFSTTP